MHVAFWADWEDKCQYTLSFGTVPVPITISSATLPGDLCYTAEKCCPLVSISLAQVSETPNPGAHPGRTLMEAQFHLPRPIPTN